MSLPETLVLSVDADGDGAGAAADETYSLYDRLAGANRSVYHSDAHTPILRDTLTFYRTPPKPTVSYYGVQKAAAKFSRDKMVDTPDGGTTRSPGIMELSGSIPIGFTEADRLHLFEEVKAFINSREACEKLFGKGEI